MLVVISTSACVEKRTPIEFSFTAMLDGRAVRCDENTVGLSDLRFFVSELILIDNTGQESPVQLRPDGQWQSRELALVDLEDGRGLCLNGTSATNATIRGDVAPGSYVDMRFVVGVPFVLNHANPLLAEAPLNDPAMHWHWRSGYKFLRVGIATAEDGFWVHLGSTGCHGTVQNIEGCDAANRLLVQLPLVAEGIPDIAVNLSVLADSTDLLDRQSSDCSSGPAEVACGPIFAAFGLQHGSVAATHEQLLFSVRK